MARTSTATPVPQATAEPCTPTGDLTPLMRQYWQIKGQHPQHVLFFRCGDFYEMFFEDAKTCASVLGITLTSRGTDAAGAPVPLAGIPYHSVEPYLAKMIRAGYRVAICEQTENPKNAKGVIRREVVRLVTPGTVLEENLLSDKANNYLVALIAEVDSAKEAARNGKSGFEQFNTTSAERSSMESAIPIGLAALDFSTGEFTITEFRGAGALASCSSELARLSPSELIVPHEQKEWFEHSQLLDAVALEGLSSQNSELRAQTLSIATVDDAACSPFAAREHVLRQFGVRDLNGFGAEGHPLAVRAAGAILYYVRDTQRTQLVHVNELSVYFPGEHMTLDATTQRSLELVCNLTDATRRHTLLEVLDRTATAMGGRLLRSWIVQPLRAPQLINRRLDAVELFVKNSQLRNTLFERLRSVSDLERIVSRSACKTANARDLLALRNSLEQIPPMHGLLSESGPAGTLIGELATKLDGLPELTGALERAIVESPPLSIREGGLIREGFDPKLDELRLLSTDSKSWIAELRQREAERTGISNLKVGFNRVFGYYLEVSNSHAAKVPHDWIRKQTLAGAERFVTPELKEKEEVILHAEERSQELEFELFEQLRDNVCAEAKRIQLTARAVAQLDAILSLAQVAVAQRYVRPRIVTSDERGSSDSPEPGSEIYIRDGRHPVLETLRLDQPFVPNDTQLDNETNQILLITGPNMAGKSTYIRQVALITLMAHLGSFVPAAQATICAVDRIFTRVGAMDQLAKGQSTFLVEMSETANILNNATDDSLVILDEIGRGTSTYDGLSIAWSVVEYLHNTRGRRPKTLFATHYHELAELEGPLSRVKNFNVAVHEEEGKVAFLYRILRGHTDHSYGIYAAQVAGLPRAAVERARRILADLEKGNAIHIGSGGAGVDKRPVKVEERTVQLTLFDAAEHPLVARLRDLDPNALTPLEALTLLAELKQAASAPR